ncbi:MAG: hypothetical protein COT18_04715 [Elusimicrobia bacterium CG08_land_8_20_14_0_20_59_10]|nr:MAG: hypothetical protein COT18_04715 [Elusimicrobia bacterium CG08_land_8_20_14_0_20_59_10]
MSLISSTRNRPDLFLRLVAAVVLAVTALSGLAHLAGGSLVSALPHTQLCFFRALTGLPCPGCGMTHAFLALGRLDFAGAFAHNPLVFPLAALLMLCAAGRIPRILRCAGVVNWALLGVLVFWCGRLLPGTP